MVGVAGADAVVEGDAGVEVAKQRQLLLLVGIACLEEHSLEDFFGGRSADVARLEEPVGPRQLTGLETLPDPPNDQARRRADSRLLPSAKQPSPELGDALSDHWRYRRPGDRSADRSGARQEAECRACRATNDLAAGLKYPLYQPGMEGFDLRQLAHPSGLRTILHS